MAIGLIGFFVAVAAAGALIGDDNDDAVERVKDYLDGSGATPFFASDAQFRATYPAYPDRSTKNIDIGGATLAFTIYMAESKDAAFSVATFDLAPTALFDLNAAVNGAAAAVKGRVESSKLTTYRDYPAAECVVSIDGGFVKELIVRAPGRVYQVQVVGRDNPPAGYDRFKASFEIAA